jgi:site-specific recombinase XerC
LQKLFNTITKHRDRAIFMVMLRCGLRVEEVANLTLAALDLPRCQLFVYTAREQRTGWFTSAPIPIMPWQIIFKVRPDRSCKEAIFG